MTSQVSAPQSTPPNPGKIAVDLYDYLARTVSTGELGLASEVVDVYKEVIEKLRAELEQGTK